MSAIFIWIHGNHAKLFHVQSKGIHVETIRYLGPPPLAESLDSEVFFRQLVDVLGQKQSTQWLLIGPDQSHQNFFHYLEKYHPKMSAHVIGIEKVEPMPDSEILSLGRKFLNDYYLQNRSAN